MKVGDLVSHVWTTDSFGLIIRWWEGAEGYVVVQWKNKQIPCHISKLEVISEY